MVAGFGPAIETMDNIAETATGWFVDTIGMTDIGVPDGSGFTIKAISFGTRF